MVSASIGLHALALGCVAVAPDTAWWALSAVGLNHLGLTAAGVWPRSRLLGQNLCRLPAAAASRGAVALTLDDGPDPEVTPAVLDLLAKMGVTATFFCIAEQARRYPALTREIVAGGHSVQNHSHGHRHHFALLGPVAMQREINSAQAVLSDITGVAPHCFRAPAGIRNPFLDLALHRSGLNLVSWTRRGFDTRDGDAGLVLGRLSRGLGVGDILLLHDGNAGRTASGGTVVLEVLGPLIQRCAALGLHCESLAQAVPSRHRIVDPLA